MTPLGAITVAFTSAVLLLARSRRIALIAILIGTIYISQTQQLAIGGFNIFAQRFLELAGLIRILTKKDTPIGIKSRLDVAVMLFYGVTTAIHLLRTRDGAANTIGSALDSIIFYYIFRRLIQTSEDFARFLRDLAILLVPFVFLVFLERIRSQNLWTNVADTGFWNRDGHIRCMGSFRHPSLLGSVGGMFLPLYIALRLSNTWNRSAWLGIALCLGIVWLSNSGGPASFALIGIAGWAFWPLRGRMFILRRGLVALVLGLWATMKAPLWFVLERVSSVTGGDGWHRSELIDRAVNSLPQWGLAGMDWSLTADWFPYLLNGGAADICDQYVASGLDAGIAGPILLVYLLTVAFKEVGRGLRAVQSAALEFTYRGYFLWGLGVSVAGTIFNWFGITYFDQTYILWAAILAAVSSLVIEATATEVSPLHLSAGLVDEDASVSSASEAFDHHASHL